MVKLSTVRFHWVVQYELTVKTRRLSQNIQESGKTKDDPIFRLEPGPLLLLLLVYPILTMGKAWALPGLDKFPPLTPFRFALREIVLATLVALQLHFILGVFLFSSQVQGNAHARKHEDSN